MDEAKPQKRKRRIWPWIVLGMFALIGALVALAPTLLVSHSFEPRTFDLAPYLGGATNLFDRTTATVNFNIAYNDEGGYKVYATGMLLDWQYNATVNIQPSFRFFGVDAKGDASITIEDTPWRLDVAFTASSSGDWNVTSAKTKAISFSHDDHVIGRILSRVNMPSISNLVFGGTFKLNAAAERTKAVPVPKWSVSCLISNVAISCHASGCPIIVENLNARAGAFGIADHLDINPIRPTAERVMAAGITFSNVFASVHCSKSQRLVTNKVHVAQGTVQDEGPSITNVVRHIVLISEAGAECCGGEVRLYSFDNNDRACKATIALDGVDAGAVLEHINGFHGEASGALYGKLPLEYRKKPKPGERPLKLYPTHLHSVPGETGILKVYDPKQVVDNLAMGGVPQETCENLTKALKDLSYDVLKISFKPDEDGKQALSIKIAGKSAHPVPSVQGDIIIPVSLEVTFHGDIDTLLNAGHIFNTGLKSIVK